MTSTLKSNLLRNNEELKNTIQSVSALSGYPQNIVKECFEFLLYNWAIKIADSPDEFAELDIPYIGKVYVKYKSDTVNPDNSISTEVEAYVNVNKDFKNLIGNIHDEGYTELIPLLEKKIENAVLVASAD